MDLNHARLPIPPRWQSELQGSGGPKAAVSGGPTLLFLQPSISLSNTAQLPKPAARKPKAEARSPSYPSFAVIEIFAFSTFDTGQPFSAASAYF
jgi:hypothetical protein